MIHNLTKDGIEQLVAHIHNIRKAITFITNHDDCISLEDDQVGDLYRAESVCNILSDHIKIEVRSTE